jgi:hypothetical protein
MTFQEKTSRSGILVITLHACQVSPNLDKHAEHGVPEAEPEPRVPVVRVCTRAAPVPPCGATHRGRTVRRRRPHRAAPRRTRGARAPAQASHGSRVLAAPRSGPPPTQASHGSRVLAAPRSGPYTGGVKTKINDPKIG